MAQSFSNAFPLESIGRDIARNNYNYESIFNALMEWNNSEKDYVTVRLMKNSAPYFHTWTFPTKKAQSKTASISLVTPVAANAFDLDGEYGMVASTDATDEGKDDVVIRINVVNRGNTRWRAFADVLILDSKDEAETLKYAVYREADIALQRSAGISIIIYRITELDPSGHHLSVGSQVVILSAAAESAVFLRVHGKPDHVSSPVIAEVLEGTLVHIHRIPGEAVSTYSLKPDSASLRVYKLPFDYGKRGYGSLCSRRSKNGASTLILEAFTDEVP